MNYSYFHSAVIPLLYTFRSLALILVFLTAILALFYSPISALAQESCGDIIFNTFGGTGSVSIEDCDNPFRVTENPIRPASFTTNGAEPLVSGQIIEVSSEEVIDVLVSASVQDVDQVFGTLFKHEGEDYVQKGQDRISDPQIPGTPTVNLSVNATGTYTFVAQTSTNVGVFPSFQQPSLFDTLRSIFILTAHAQIGFESEVFTRTFSVEFAEPEPQGASSVLFLPGIQASRLYKDGLLGTEDQIWEPNGNGDVRQLEMTGGGESVNDVYTRDVIDEIGLPFLGSDIYKDFLSDLERLQSDGIIKNYEPFAYDWRYSVFDVATEPVQYPDGDTKLLLEEVLRLAEESYTGKVTIIGHSNGGLVAKALLEEYGDAELEGKVDKLIMIGTPQLGTPKGVGAMLHGDILEGFGDLVLSDGLLRETIKNMPGAYTLLPSEKYFTTTGGVPLVSADSSLVASAIRSYGLINTRSELDRLLLDTLDVIPDNPSINQPLTLNENLLQAARDEQAVLDSWQAPEGVAIYEVVGTGLATIVGFEYQEYGCSNNPACSLNSFVKPSAIFANNGDETVVRDSAGAYEGSKTTATVDLRLEGNQAFIKERNHANLTESPTVQIFVESVIKFPYLVDSIQAPEFSEVATRYTIVSTHSPVSPRIITSDGSIVGRNGDEVFEEVIGSQYLEIAGSTYLIIPQAEDDYTIEVRGTDDGVYTLRIDELSEDNQQSQIAQIVATTTGQMVATMEVIDDEPQNLLSDIDGDGEVDQEWTPAGELVTEESGATYDDLQNVISTIDHRSTKRYLEWLARKAERYNNKVDKHPVYARLENRLLRVLERTVRFGERRGRITDEQGDELQKIINSLLNK